MSATTASATPTASLITQEMRQQYSEEGYFVLERALPEADLLLLRSPHSKPWT